MDALEQHIRALEEQLLRPDVRASEEALDALLADDFLEHGSSGRKFDKRAILDELRHEPPAERSLHDFALTQLSADVVLATYTGVSRSGQPPEEKRSLRSSIWVHRRGRWQLVFHQGTGLAGSPESR